MKRESGKNQDRTLNQWALVAAVLVVAVLCARFLYLFKEGRPMTLARTAALQVTSSSFPSNGWIPQQYTCEGANLSPQLHWSGAPAKTRSMTVLMHDPDAPADFTHWVLYNVDPRTEELAAGDEMPPGALQGRNSFGRLGYGGPCPPPGKTHHYIFQVYALDALLRLPAGATRQEVEAAIEQHLLADGQVVGLYRR